MGRMTTVTVSVFHPEVPFHRKQTDGTGSLKIIVNLGWGDHLNLLISFFPFSEDTNLS